MRQFVDEIRPDLPGLTHLTQVDQGFRKTRALNLAVCAASARRLIFLDGDCVPHRRFVENHLRYAAARMLTAGRRVQLGPRLSQWLRGRPSRITVLQNTFSYLLLAPAFHFDGGRNYEAGFASRWLQRLRGDDPRFILGCNFSCDRADLLAINGFNEDYVQPGAGEDTDLEWRFQRSGVRLRSVRFAARRCFIFTTSRVGRLPRKTSGFWPKPGSAGRSTVATASSAPHNPRDAPGKSAAPRPTAG